MSLTPKLHVTTENKNLVHYGYNFSRYLPFQKLQGDLSTVEWQFVFCRGCIFVNLFQFNKGVLFSITVIENL